MIIIVIKYLKKGLEKTRATLSSKFEQLFGKKEINQDFYDELEEILISADVGVETSLKVIQQLQEEIGKRKVRDSASAREILKEILVEIMEKDVAGFLTLAVQPPTVILIIGVNGVGKTTTIAKMASSFIKQGKSVLLAAGDTFRAAAIEQLDEWSKSVGAAIIKHQTGGDPSAVIFDAVKAAQARHVDVVLCDTAGRLHTKVNLLQEMKKIYRTIEKALPGAPHETLLVLDATTGHNGIAQARLFKEAIFLTGIVLTKLDGTARGGIVIAVKDTTGLPVKLIGVGEKEDDLQPFRAADFVEVLLS